MKCQGKLKIQTQENYEKSHFGPILGPYIGAANFFIKNLALSVTRCHGQLFSCTMPEKNNDPILRKFSDGWTDEQTD